MAERVYGGWGLEARRRTSKSGLPSCCPFSYARSLSPPPPPISSSSYIRHAAVVLSFWGRIEGNSFGNFVRGDRGSGQIDVRRFLTLYRRGGGGGKCVDREKGRREEQVGRLVKRNNTFRVYIAWRLR